MAAIHTLITRLFLLFIYAYRYLVSPLIGQVCRFEPSCSSYAVEAMRRYGWLTGGVYVLRRLLRCRPGCKGGVDLLP